jgi:ribosome recycling factor
MEADKRVSEIDWSWAVSQINRVVNETLLKIEEDDTINPDDKKKRLNEIEKAWQRILVG